MVQWSMTPVAISCGLYHQSQVQSSLMASFLSPALVVVSEIHSKCKFWI